MTPKKSTDAIKRGGILAVFSMFLTITRGIQVAAGVWVMVVICLIAGLIYYKQEQRTLSNQTK